MAAAEEQRRKLHNELVDLKGAIRVFCRIRPLLPHEAEPAPAASSSAKASRFATLSSRSEEGSAEGSAEGLREGSAVEVPVDNDRRLRLISEVANC